MGIETVTYTLPEYVACYAMYGDPSGDDELDSAYDTWLVDTMEYEGFKTMCLIGVEGDGFMRYHELRAYGIGACDCDFFSYHVTRSRKDLESVQ